MGIAKLAIHAFRNLSSKVSAKTSSVLAASKSNPTGFYERFGKKYNNYEIQLQNKTKTNVRSIAPSVVGTSGFLISSLLLAASKSNPRLFQRFVTRSNYLRWTAGIALGLGTGFFIYAMSMETVPFTNRTRSILGSIEEDIDFGERRVMRMKKSSVPILPETHPQTLRARNIFNDITRVASKHTKIPFHWELFIVDDPRPYSFCHSGGKIEVYAGVLQQFKSDAEIATLIGHEVAHAVARHPAEQWTWSIVFGIIEFFTIVPCFYASFFTPGKLNPVKVYLELPASRRTEAEADYIGLLLMASAGYDPRVAPNVYKKLALLFGERLEEVVRTHPLGKNRALLLSQPQVMEAAVSLYQESLIRKL